MTLALVVAYVRSRRGADAVARLLELAGETRPLAELEDGTGWSTQDQKIRLFEAAAVVLDDPLAPRHIGQTVLELRTAASLKLLLRTLGSPGALFRSVAKASAKFSTNYTCEAISVGRREAVISNRLHDGYEPRAVDCAYTAGLLSTVPAVFGLPLASVEHDVCQVLGGPACIYQLRWRPRSRLPWRAARVRRAYLLDQLRVVTDRYESLQSTLVDLVSPADVATVLGRITRRAVDAVRAQQFLLAIVGDEGGPPLLHYDGITAEEAARLADAVLSPTPADLGPSILIAEVASARRSYGRLVAMYDRDHTFFPEEERLLATYARQAAVALDAATALAEVRQRGETAQALLDLARALGAAQSSAEVANALATAVPVVIGGHRSIVMAWDAERRELATIGSSHPAEPGVELAVLRDSDSSSLALFVETLTPQRLTPETCDPHVAAVLRERRLVEALSVPIVSDGALLGAIVAVRQAADPPFVDERLLAARLSGLADHAALALAKVRLLEHEREVVGRLRREEARNRHLADHDALTGLPNSRRFAVHLDEALADGGRSPGSVAVLFCDLDRFKDVNDSLGHARGDELLCHAANRLRSSVRGAVVARLGGDEFAVLVRDADAASAAAALATRMIDTLAEPFRMAGFELRVSASIGIAVHPADGADATALVINADAAMYAAKRAGRNAFRRFGADTAARTASAGPA